MSIAEFVLNHTFKNVLSMKKGFQNDSKIVKHFGIPWRARVKRNGDQLGLFLHCEKEKTGKEWSIEVWGKLKVSSTDGKHFSKSGGYIFKSTDESAGMGFCEFIKWEDMMKDYVIDNTLNVEIHIDIKKMTGIKNKYLRKFDESNKKFSDVVLVVENQKFYVSKLFLAGGSSYFNAILLGNSKESKKEEVALTGMKAEDFQNFMEVLHGELAIDDETVTGIVHLADKCHTNVVIRQCEEFLMEKSEKSVKEKLELSTKYKLDNLKSKCLLEIKSIDDIRSVLR